MRILNIAIVGATGNVGRKILEVLEEYITNLKEFKSLMEQKDYKTVFKKIQETNAIREILAGIN